MALVVFASVPARAEPSFDDPLCPPNPSFPPIRSAPANGSSGPNTGQWIPLLAPPGQTVVGTSGTDALAAGGEGDVVDGLVRQRCARELFDRTALIGERGTTSSPRKRTRFPTGLLRAYELQLGGPGNDTHAPRST